LLLFASLLLLASLLLFGLTVVTGVIVVPGFPSFTKSCLLLQEPCCCIRSWSLCCFVTAVDPALCQAFAAVGFPGVLLFSFLLLTVFNQTVADTDAEDPFLLAFLLMMTSLRLLSWLLLLAALLLLESLLLLRTLLLGSLLLMASLLLNILCTRLKGIADVKPTSVENSTYTYKLNSILLILSIS